MLKEFFDAIGQQAVKAAVPFHVQPLNEPAYFYYLRTADGTLERHEAKPSPRAHKTLDIASLVRFGAALDTGESSPVLWYSRVGLVLIVDDATRRDRVSMSLEFSPQMLLLQSLERETKWYTQAQFLSLLRVKLGACLINHPALIPSLRKIKFRTSSEGGSEIVQAKASVGKSLSAELSGAEPIPEEVTLSVSIFNGRAEYSEIVCSLDVDPEKVTFSLTPLAGAVEDAIREGESQLRNVIASEMDGAQLDVPVYYGTP